MSDEDVRLTISDLRPLFCVKGIRAIFNSIGLDFAQFLKDGAMASELYGLGYDAQVDRAVAAKKQKEV